MPANGVSSEWRVALISAGRSFAADVNNVARIWPISCLVMITPRPFQSSRAWAA